MAAPSSNKLLITLISLLILLIIGGVAAFVFYLDKEDKSAMFTQEKQLPVQQNNQEERLAEIGPLYPLAPITVNLRSTTDKDVYLKISLSLELSNKLLANELDAKNAVIRDNIILILSSKSVADIDSDTGKALLCDEIKEKLNTLLDDGYIKNVYIVSFVIE